MTPCWVHMPVHVQLSIRHVKHLLHFYVYSSEALSMVTSLCIQHHHPQCPSLRSSAPPSTATLHRLNSNFPSSLFPGPGNSTTLVSEWCNSFLTFLNRLLLANTPIKSMPWSILILAPSLWKHSLFHWIWEKWDMEGKRTPMICLCDQEYRGKPKKGFFKKTFLCMHRCIWKAETEKGKDLSVSSQSNGQNSQGWAKPKPGTQHSIQVYYMEGRDPSHWAIFHHLSR